MSFAGTRLGPYEIVALLGAGGMGEVFRARDTKLGRDVAIKILPAAFTSDPDRLARFEREARVLASLNHPHIAQIYGLDRQEGQDGRDGPSVPFIVMELVEGETLDARLKASRSKGGVGVKSGMEREGFSRALPIAEALAIARQIADALDAAHERGIVHRDLKPANIIITPDGVVKVLDFGLAKSAGPGGSGGQDGLTHSPTVMAPTIDGVLLGTAPYMSPEQARGKAVDKRTDIWAFGCVLYEMLTGQRAFAGETTTDTLAAILEREPDWAALPASMPPTICRLPQRCLEKDPKRRLHDIADARIEIDDALAAPTATTAPAPIGSSRRGWLWPAALAASVLVGVLAIRLSQRPSAVQSWQNPLANAKFNRLTDFEGSEMNAAISPDGKFVAFLSDRDGPFDAFVTQVGSGEFNNLTKGREPELLNEIVQNVGFSSDSSHVWMRVGEVVPLGKPGLESIWLTPTMGGAGRLFIDNAVMTVWSPDGSKVAYHGATAGDAIHIANSNGSNARQVFVGKPGTHNHFLTWSPDARDLYFARGFPLDEMDIWRISSTGGEAERITRHNSRVAYPTFLNERTLIYIATAEDGTGPWLYTMDVKDRVPYRVNVSVEQYLSIAASAELPGQPRRLVATVSNPSVNLWTVPISERLVDDAGASRLALPTARSAGPRFGPNYLVYLASRGGADGLWKSKGGNSTELWQASEGAVAGAAAVSPDGQQLCFPVRRQGRTTLYAMTAEGTNARVLAESLDVRGAASWSPDANWIAVAANQGDGPRLFKVPVNGGPAVSLVETVSSNPVWSPDGLYILYSGEQLGRSVPVKAVTPEGKPYPLPELWVYRIGENYRFLPGGKELVLMQGGFRRQNFWLFDLKTGRQRQLTNLQPGSSLRSFDVSRDGTTILFDRVRENSDIVLIELPGKQSVP